MSDFVQFKNEEEEDGEDIATQFRKTLDVDSRHSAKSKPLIETSEQSSNPTGFLVENESVVYRELSPPSGLSTRKRLVTQYLPQPIYNALKPPTNKKEFQHFWQIHVPIWHWLYYYVPKFILGDIVAGLTIGVTHVPQGIGFALLALVPPVFGLYSSFLPVLLYTIFGTSRHLSVGTFPIVSLMTAHSVNRVGAQYPDCNDDFNNTSMNMTGDDDDCYLSSCNLLRVDIAITLSFLVGLIMILMSFLKLGFVSLFLSDALISGYTAAAAFSIVVTQILYMFGIEDAAVSDGWFVTPRRLIKYCTRIVQGRVNPAAIVTSVICFIILITVELSNRFIKKKFKKVPIYIPGQLIVVVITTFIAYIAKLDEKYDLPVINDIGGIPPGKCFHASVPRASLVLDLMTDAFVIAVVGFVLNIAQAKLLASKNGYSIYPDQELFAYGIMNFGGSFLGSIPTAGALSRTVLQDAVGGNTQLVGLISSVLVLFVILVLGFLFDSLPNAAVAVIVVMALKGLLFQVRDVRRYFYLHWPDMIVWFVVFSATLILRLDIGLLIGVCTSILMIVGRTILPFSAGLGEASVWVYPPKSSSQYEENDLKVQPLQNIYIYQFNAPIYFANCGVFRSRLLIDCNLSPHVFDKVERSCFAVCCQKGSSNNVERLEESEQQSNEVYSDDEMSLQDINATNSIPGHYHTIIIDCGPIGFVDSMGMATLDKVVTDLDSINIQVLLASPNTPLCDALNRYGFFKRHSSEMLFPSVSSAVRYAKGGNKLPVVEPERISKKLATNLERQLALPKRPTLFELSSVERSDSPHKVSTKQNETSL